MKKTLYEMMEFIPAKNFDLSLWHVAERDIAALNTYSKANALRKIADVVEACYEQQFPLELADGWMADAQYCIVHLFDFPSPNAVHREEGGDLQELAGRKYAEKFAGGETLLPPMADDED